MKAFLEYIGGSSDQPPCGWRVPLASPLWGLWWGVLLALIMLFCGQSSKFIYIDF